MMSLKTLEKLFLEPSPGFIAGFRVSVIYTMDRNIFKDDEFLSAFVTYRPNPMDEQPIGIGINVAPGENQAPAQNEVIPTPFSLVNTLQPVEVNPVLLVCKETTSIKSPRVVDAMSPAHRQKEPRP